MQKLFSAVQSACSKAVWSRGVELVRADAVEGERAEDEEIVLRVTTRQALVAPVVTLYPEDEDWECTCRGQEDPCEHVAAAVIALRQARKAGERLPRPAAAAARIRYAFRSQGARSLSFEREVVAPDGSVEPLAYGLKTLAAGRVAGPRIAATPVDMAVERVLPTERGGVLPAEVMARILDALAGSEDVVLDGRSVAASSDRVLPIVRVVDAPGGVRVYVEADRSVTRAFENGVVLCGDTLRAVGEARLTGREREDLVRGRFFPDAELPALVTDVLPSLEERLPVERATTRLPDTTRSERPRIVVAVEREDDRLSVFPTLVYGDPPTARVDAGRLVHLRGPIPVRDEAAERACLGELADGLGLAPGHRTLLSGDEAIAMAERLHRWSGPVVGDALREFTPLGSLAPRLEMDGDRFDLDFALDGEAAGDARAGERPPPAGAARRVGADAVVSAWRAGEGWVSVGQLGFARLPADWLARFGDRVADLLAARAEDGSLPASALPDLGRLCAELDAPPPPGLERLRPLLEDFSGIPPATLPEGLQGELRTYQRAGVDWLHFLRAARLGALLADDMGLGKTVQAIAALTPRALVVAPTSLLHNWAEEIERFRPDLRVQIYHGPRRALDPEADVVLTSYAILRLDTDLLVADTWSTAILDEAQNIKNADSQAAQAAYRIRADFRIALTGTPVENRLEELWSQLHFLNPGLLGGRADFETRYARPIAEGDEAVAARLRERIRPFVLRRLKRDVAPELPPRTDLVLHCELDDEERAVYDAIRAAGVERVVEQLRAGGGVMAALEVLLRLRQAACHAALVPGQEAARSTKLELLGERLEQAMADGHRALVFSQWTALLDLVEPVLRDAGIAFTRLDGSTRDRAAVVKRFADEDGPPVMLVSLKAGGTGLNLTAADHVFLLDPWWNPAVEDQAADRAHRIGQTRPVVIHRLVARHTVEEGILALHARKRALSETALGADGTGDGLSREDLLALLDQ
jgi:superfamily II DNA or RNA helicase